MSPHRTRVKNEQQLDTILDVALKMADEQGLEAVSIRKLASEIGVAPMTVYGYVTSKEDLLTRMAERCLDRFETPVLASSDWTDHVRAIMTSLRELLLSHPSLVGLLSRRRVMSLGLTRSIDATLHHLHSAGFSGPESVEAYGALVSLTLGSVVLKLPRSIDEDAADVKFAIRHLRNLADGRFPMVTKLASELSTMARDRTFEMGLDSLIAGLRARLGDGSSR